MKLTEPAYFVLAALIDGPRHGYDIAAQATELSGERVKLSAGTLYGVLDRLREQDLIELDSEETVNGRLRRYYKITGAGETAARDEATRMSSAAKVVTAQFKSVTA
ncbi:MAG: helix-turn-helix transcriptional regulator [Thermoleophilaceae bacterium]|nr:helix-turn-helix transcriptional regulator [Thermoleophilaceae bacterium]